MVVAHTIAVSIIIGLYSFGLIVFRTNLANKGLPINISVRYANINSTAINFNSSIGFTF